MPTNEELGIKALESIHYYVHDLERSRRFYTQVMGFAEIGVSSPELEKAGHQRSAAVPAADRISMAVAGPTFFTVMSWSKRSRSSAVAKP